VAFDATHALPFGVLVGSTPAVVDTVALAVVDGAFDDAEGDPEAPTGVVVDPSYAAGALVVVTEPRELELAAVTFVSPAQAEAAATRRHRDNAASRRRRRTVDRAMGSIAAP
jgi:hypothetical protein